MRTQVSDIAALAGLIALEEIAVGGTQITDIAPLAGLAKLQSQVRRSPNDIAPLAGLTALQVLSLFDTPISDLAPLAGLTALQELSSAAHGSATSPRSPGHTALREPRPRRHTGRCLAPSPASPPCGRIGLGWHPVGDLAPLAGLSALQELRPRVVQGGDRAPLAGMTSLQDGLPRRNSLTRPPGAIFPMRCSIARMTALSTELVHLKQPALTIETINEVPAAGRPTGAHCQRAMTTGGSPDPHP